MPLLTIAFASETREVPSDQLTTINHLHVLIQSFFWSHALPTSYSLKYVDEDGDLISVSCDSDVTEMLRSTSTLMIVPNKGEQLRQIVSPAQRNPSVATRAPSEFVLSPNERFRKMWYVANSGNSAWPDSCHMVHLRGHRFGSFPSFVVASLQPQETIEMDVHFIAPACVGRYEGVWQLIDPQGFPLSEEVIVSVDVCNDIAPAVFPGFPRNTNFNVFPGLHDDAGDDESECQVCPNMTTAESRRRELVQKLHERIVQAPGSRFREIWSINNKELASKGVCCRAVTVGDCTFSTFPSWMVMPTDCCKYVIDFDLTVPTDKGQYDGKWQLVASDGQVVAEHEIHVVVEQSLEVSVFPGLPPTTTTAQTDGVSHTVPCSTPVGVEQNMLMSFVAL